MPGNIPTWSNPVWIDLFRKAWARLLETGAGPMSYSQLATWITCRKKWHWKYRQRIEVIRKRRAPTIGAAGHLALAALLRGEDWIAALDNWAVESCIGLFDEDKDDIRVYASTVKVLVQMYTDKYPNLEAVLVEWKWAIGPFCGIWDAIVEDSEHLIWLVENKFPQSFRAEDDLILDSQLAIYHWAALAMGYPIVGIIYNQLLGKEFTIPNLNKNGSASRTMIHCPWFVYKAFLEKNHLSPLDYEDMRLKLGDTDQFFRRYKIYRSPEEAIRYFDDLMIRMDTMGGPIYYSDGMRNCRGCEYRELCIASLKGGDVEAIINTDFTRREVKEDEPRSDSTESEPTYPDSAHSL